MQNYVKQIQAHTLWINILGSMSPSSINLVPA